MVVTGPESEIDHSAKTNAEEYVELYLHGVLLD
jgi:hypothetical protein